jgi:tellurite resistance protein
MGIALSHRRADRVWRRRGAASGARLAVAALAAALLCACLTSVARADAGEKIIERCTHGQSLSGFSQQDYRRALQELPTEVEEYSDCGNLIRRAQLAAAGGHGGANGGGEALLRTATPLQPKEQSALKALPKTGSLARRIGGTLVRPGVVHANVASAFSSLPASLLAVLAFLLACALALIGRSVGRMVRARRSD